MFEDFFLGNQVIWEVKESDHLKVKNISDKLMLPTTLSDVLIKRGLTDIECIKSFLKPSIKNLHDPMLLPDMDIAVERIIKAKQNAENIIIYGDYDVDGITSTSILYLFFQSIGIKVSFYIPDRIDEGYGISDKFVDYLNENHFDLMITVDCGISSRNIINEINDNLSAKGHNMDIIVTDHHQPDMENLPVVLALINPHLPYSEYPFDKLCGAGVVFKLVQALCCKLELGDEYLYYIDLACLGTVADIVELTGENRVIVSTGLKKINRLPNLGIKALLDVAQIKDEIIDAYKLAFIVAPRINAAGRMGDASRAVKLFTTHDISTQEKLAKVLQDENNLRQKIQLDIYEKALESIESDTTYNEQKIIVVSGDGWHQGVIGIVSSLLVEHFHKPCFVISVFGDIATCSARSIEGFNIYEGMEYCKDLLVKYGGHEQAGGLTINKSNINKFREKINEFAQIVMHDTIMKPKIVVDADISINDINIELADYLMAMAPFGEGNPKPLFRIRDVNVIESRQIGFDKSHLKLLLQNGNSKLSAVAFRMANMQQLLNANNKIDLICEIGINEYMGKRNVQLFVKAIRLHENQIKKNKIMLEIAEKFEYLDNNKECIYNSVNNFGIAFKDINITRQELGVIYKHILEIGKCTLTTGQLFVHTQKLSEKLSSLNCFKMLIGFIILDELDIIVFSRTNYDEFKIKLPENTERTSLLNSKILSFINNLQQVVEK